MLPLCVQLPQGMSCCLVSLQSSSAAFLGSTSPSVLANGQPCSLLYVAFLLPPPLPFAWFSCLVLLCWVSSVLCSSGESRPFTAALCPGPRILSSSSVLSLIGISREAVLARRAHFLVFQFLGKNNSSSESDISIENRHN